MKLEEISVTNFKVIDRLSFKPKMINLIVGKNNTGKTSLLEAINCIFNFNDIADSKYPSNLVNSFSQEAELLAQSDGKARQVYLKKPDSQTTERLFRNQVMNSLKKIEARNQIMIGLKEIEPIKFTKSIQDDIEKILSSYINKDLSQRLSEKSIVAIKDENEYLYFSPSSIEGAVLRNMAESISAYLHDTFKIKIPSYFIAGSLFMRYAKILRTRQVIFIRELKLSRGEDMPMLKLPHENKHDDEATKFHKIGELIKEHKLLKNFDGFGVNYSLVFKEGDETWSHPLDLMGDGFKAIVAFLQHTISDDVQNKVILIEEPELHMHPGYIRELMKFIIKFSNEKHIQFFMTSHSIDLIDSFLDENLPIEERNYLKNEFSILETGCVKTHFIPQILDYETALSDKKNLLADLRGV